MWFISIARPFHPLCRWTVALVGVCGCGVWFISIARLFRPLGDVGGFDAFGGAGSVGLVDVDSGDSGGATQCVE